MGFIKPKSIIQKDSMNDDLRNGLWNTFYKFCAEPYVNAYYNSTREELLWQNFFKTIWSDWLKLQLDQMSYKPDVLLERIKRHFYIYQFNITYDFIEFIVDIIPHHKDEFIYKCNEVLRREMSAYQFIGYKLAPITSEIEINEVESALSNTDIFLTTSEHINKALEHFSNKTNPDYRNSIKESISAVEATCCTICDSTSATLSQALKTIEKTNAIDLHPSLKSSFDKLYGYTSDGDGIRHALSGESNLSEEDARFMLISCSAFTNYLIVKYNKR